MRWMRVGPVIAFSLSLVAVAPADVLGAPSWLSPPVDSVITRYFEPPESDFGPGHRGIDYGVVPGVKVRAAAAGVVAFAGSVAGTKAVTLDHGDGLVTTYTRLGAISVLAGMTVDQGHFIGTTSSAHPGEWAGLHFGVKMNSLYVDPLTFLGPVDVSDAIRLAPTVEELEGRIDSLLITASGRAGTHHRACVDTPQTRGRPPAPSDNVAVSIAGMNSSTSGGAPDLYTGAFGATALGFPPERSYRYSYRGIDHGDLHRPYSRLDTQGDLRAAARRLISLLRAIARRHPGERVDLIAHSQGGIVARAALEMMASDFDPALPPVEHLVTLATPHEGTPLAGLLRDLRTKTFTGRLALSGLSKLAGRSGVVPDPEATAVKQLAPGSDLLVDLAGEDIAYGTRILALGDRERSGRSRGPFGLPRRDEQGRRSGGGLRPRRPRSFGAGSSQGVCLLARRGATLSVVGRSARSSRGRSHLVRGKAGPGALFRARGRGGGTGLARHQGGGSSARVTGEPCRPGGARRRTVGARHARRPGSPPGSPGATGDVGRCGAGMRQEKRAPSAGGDGRMTEGAPVPGG